MGPCLPLRTSLRPPIVHTYSLIISPCDVSVFLMTFIFAFVTMKNHCGFFSLPPPPGGHGIVKVIRGFPIVYQLKTTRGGGGNTIEETEQLHVRLIRISSDGSSR